MPRIIAAILLVVVLAIGGGIIATTAYQAGLSTAVTTTTAAGGTVVAPVVVPAYGYGWHPFGFGFGIFGFFAALFFLFVIFGADPRHLLARRPGPARRLGRTRLLRLRVPGTGRRHERRPRGPVPVGVPCPRHLRDLASAGARRAGRGPGGRARPADTAGRPGLTGRRSPIPCAPERLVRGRIRLYDWLR